MTNWKAAIGKVDLLDFCDLLYEEEVIEKKEIQKSMDIFVNQKTETNMAVVNAAKHSGRQSAFAEIRKSLENKDLQELEKK